MWPSSVPSRLRQRSRGRSRALVGPPRELEARPAITIRVAAVEFSRHRDEAQFAEAIIIELDKAGLDQINSLLIPVVHLGDTPSADDARALGHAARLAARKGAQQRPGQDPYAALRQEDPRRDAAPLISLVNRGRQGSSHPGFHERQGIRRRVPGGVLRERLRGRDNPAAPSGCAASGPRHPLVHLHCDRSGYPLTR